MRIEQRKKLDFKVDQEFYYLESTRDREQGYNRKPKSLEIQKLTVKKIGNSYIYFENSRYKIGSSHTEYLWSGNEYHNDTNVDAIFNSELESVNEISRLELIDQLTPDWEARKFLRKLSRKLLEKISVEVQQ